MGTGGAIGTGTMTRNKLFRSISEQVDMTAYRKAPVCMNRLGVLCDADLCFHLSSSAFLVISPTLCGVVLMSSLSGSCKISEATFQGFLPSLLCLSRPKYSSLPPVSSCVKSVATPEGTRLVVDITRAEQTACPLRNIAIQLISGFLSPRILSNF
eukprot:2335047-Rhodomonas_salina.2